MKLPNVPFGDQRAPVDVALQRPTTNALVGKRVEQKDKATVGDQPDLTFSRHATFGPARPHLLENL